MGVYFGESSRTCYDRGAEHGVALSKMDINSPLVEHHQEHHEGRTPKFTMELVQRFTRPLERQVMEGVLIQEFRGDYLLNRRGEWGQNLPPQFTTVREEQGRMEFRSAPKKRVPEPEGEPEIETEMDMTDSKRRRLEVGVDPTQRGHQERAETETNVRQVGDPGEDQGGARSRNPDPMMKVAPGSLPKTWLFWVNKGQSQDWGPTLPHSLRSLG